jgi:hypothetical protein
VPSPELALRERMVGGGMLSGGPVSAD